MGFDLATAKPVGGFDIATAKPLNEEDAAIKDYQDRQAATVQMLKNIPASAGKFFGGVAQSVLHPIDSVSNMLDLGAGALRNSMPEGVRSFVDQYDPNPQVAERSSNMATAVGQAYKQRYGGLENIKNTMIEDPVGVAADVSTLLGLGGALVPGRVGNALATASNYTNPISAIPAVVNAGMDASKWAANSLMHSAIKPTLRQLQRGEAETAIQELLDRGISPTRGGVGKLRDLIDEKNAAITQRIGNSGATVNPLDVSAYLGETRRRFMNQVDPAADIAAINGVGSGFANHPIAQGPIPVTEAQQLKVGTYQALRDKFGQLGSAETEAQKALARGLKEEIAAKVPGVAELNAEESKLLTTLNVAERRALLELNKNPMGLSLLTHSPKLALLYMADKSAPFKALLARIINRVGVTAPEAATNALAPYGQGIRGVGLGAGQLANIQDQ